MKTGTRQREAKHLLELAHRTDAAAVGEDEGVRVAAAMDLTGKDLKEAVRKRAGGEDEDAHWGMRTMRRRMTAEPRDRLERRFAKLPVLREAMKAGRITYSRALLISRDATPLDVEARIAEAESTTWQRGNRPPERGAREMDRANEEIETVADDDVRVVDSGVEARGLAVEPALA